MTGDPPVQDEVQSAQPDSQESGAETLQTDPEVPDVQTEHAMDPTGSGTAPVVPDDGADAAVSHPPGSMLEQQGIVTP